MANIATGFVRLFPKHDPHPHLLPVGDILRLLCGWEGRSYHVPVFVRQNEFSLVTDFQFGDKWAAYHGIEEVWEQYRSDLEAIWWRNYDSGGDHDSIGWIDEAGPSHTLPGHNPRWCCYGFDHLRITWQRGHAIFGVGMPWDKDAYVTSIAIRGSYRAGNDRCNLLLGDPDRSPMPTPTTLTRGYDTDQLTWDLDEFRPPFAQLLSICQTHAESVEFLWNQRLVRCQRSAIHGASGRRYWQNYSLDDWDNCVDADWLAFSGLSFATDPAE